MSELYKSIKDYEMNSVKITDPDFKTKYCFSGISKDNLIGAI